MKLSGKSQTTSDCTLCRPAKGGKVVARRLLIAVFGMLLAAPAAAIDLDEMTVVTLARDGSWGVATAASQGEAIAAAIRGCRAMAGAATDCGAQLTTTRGGWVIANLCGDHKIIVAAETRQAAEAAALDRETRLRRAYVRDLPPCLRALTVDSSGAIATTEPRYSGRAKAERPAPR